MNQQHGLARDNNDESQQQQTRRLPQKAHGGIPASLTKLGCHEPGLRYKSCSWPLLYAPSASSCRPLSPTVARVHAKLSASAAICCLCMRQAGDVTLHVVMLYMQVIQGFRSEDQTCNPTDFSCNIHSQTCPSNVSHGPCVGHVSIAALATQPRLLSGSPRNAGLGLPGRWTFPLELRPRARRTYCAVGLRRTSHCSVRP